MRLRPVSSLRLLASFGVLSLLSAGCTDEKIVYREPFNPPPDAEAGFVGYFTTSDKSTTCGNCHVDHENKWVGTAHADAYASLVDSGHASDNCFGCHTVSERGNAVSEPAGWNAVQDTAYHDVQCESCHGPGVDHVETPDATAPPLARDPGARVRRRNRRRQRGYGHRLGLLRRVSQRVASSLRRRVAVVRSRASGDRGRRWELHRGSW